MKRIKYTPIFLKLFFGIIAVAAINFTFINQNITSASTYQVASKNDQNSTAVNLVNGIVPFSDSSTFWLSSAIFPDTPNASLYGKALATSVYQILVDSFLKPFIILNAPITNHDNVIPTIFYNLQTKTVDLDTFIQQTKIGENWKQNNFVQQDVPLPNENNVNLRATTKFIDQLLIYYLLPLDQLPCFKVFTSPTSNSTQQAVGPLEAFLKAMFYKQEGDKLSDVYDQKYNSGLFDFDAGFNASYNYSFLPANLIFLLQMYYNFLAHVEFKYYESETKNGYLINFDKLELLGSRAYIQLSGLRDWTFKPQDDNGLITDGNNYNIFTAFPWFFINAGYGVNPWFPNSTRPGECANWKKRNMIFHSTGIWEINPATRVIFLNHANDLILNDLHDQDKKLQKSKFTGLWHFAWQSMILFFQTIHQNLTVNYFSNLFTPVKPNQLIPNENKLLSNFEFWDEEEFFITFAKKFANFLTGTGFTRDFVQKEWENISNLRNNLLIIYKNGLVDKHYFMFHLDGSTLNFPLPHFIHLWNKSSFENYQNNSQYYQNFVKEQHHIAEEYNDAQISSSTLSTPAWIGIITSCAIATALLTIGLWQNVFHSRFKTKNKK